jgi:hypothetical protein
MNKYFNLTSITVAFITAFIVFYILNRAFPRKSPTTLDVFNYAIDDNVRNSLRSSGTKLNDLIDDIEKDEDKIRKEAFSQEAKVSIIKKRKEASKIYSEMAGTLSTSMPNIISFDYESYPVAKEWMKSFQQAANDPPILNKPLIRYKLE